MGRDNHIGLVPDDILQKFFRVERIGERAQRPDEFVDPGMIEKFIKKETMERYDYLLHHKGAFLIFLLFLIPGFPKDSLCYIIGLGHLTTKEFLVISTVGRFGGTVLLTLGGNYIHRHQYYSFFVLIGVAIIVVFLSMVYKDKLEHVFKKLHRQHKGEDRK